MDKVIAVAVVILIAFALWSGPSKDSGRVGQPATVGTYGAPEARNKVKGFEGARTQSSPNDHGAPPGEEIAGMNRCVRPTGCNKSGH